MVCLLGIFGPLSAAPGESSPSNATNYPHDGDISPLFILEDNRMGTTLQEDQVNGHSQTEGHPQSTMELVRF
jgi:hypothetical protein